jgi:glycolate oxidase FAD binding subunit
MAEALKPRDGKDVEQAVQWALAEGRPLEVLGRGSKRALGRPGQSDLTLDLSGLSGVTLYEPEELVLSAQAGTPLAEIEALVREKGQQLAFEPMDYGPVLGGPAGDGSLVGGSLAGGSLGGALAVNLSGPRRIKAGAARDHFLGVTAVSGRGETFKSGGRVVKNVTGYDLCKVLAGSFGTLAAMTEVTIKTLPRPETEETILLLGLDDVRANAAMTAAMISACDVSAAAHLPTGLAASFDGLNAAATAFRLEGFAPSVRHRKSALIEVLRPFGTPEFLDEQRSRAFWLGVRDVKPFWVGSSDAERSLWRISTTPSHGSALTALLPHNAQWFYDWAGGLIWAVLPASDDGGAAAVRNATGALGGHATLVRAPAAVRAALDVFEPRNGALATVSRRVKESFDPKGILNPGRMWAGV